MAFRGRILPGLSLVHANLSHALKIDRSGLLSAAALSRRRHNCMAVLLSFSQRAHWNIVLLEPAGDSIGIAPFIFRVTVDAGNLNGAKLLLNILLYEPVSILIKLFGSQSLSHVPSTSFL